MITAITAATPTVAAQAGAAQTLADQSHGLAGGLGFVPCMLFGLLVLGLIALAVFGWFRRRPAGSTGSGGARDAEDLLAERYAKGEMSDDEYLQRQSVLRDHQNRKK